MQRVHVSPRVGGLAVDDLTTAHVEALAKAMLADGLSPKTIRNVLSFLHSIIEHAINGGWVCENHVRLSEQRRLAGPRFAADYESTPTVWDLSEQAFDELHLRLVPNEPGRPLHWSRAGRPQQGAPDKASYAAANCGAS